MSSSSPSSTAHTPPTCPNPPPQPPIALLPLRPLPRIPTAENLRIEHHTAATLPPELLHACLRLVEQTSSAAYRASSIGWNEKRKVKEMRDSRMRWMLVLQDRARGGEVDGGIEAQGATEFRSLHDGVRQETQFDGKPGTTGNASITAGPAVSDSCSALTAFLSYMHTTDETLPPWPASNQRVLYIYELHVSPLFQNCQLGTHLLRCAEDLARQAGDAMTMLTVFVSNVRGMGFYHRSGYVWWDEEVVETVVKRRRLRSGIVREPEDAKLPRGPSYVILAKDLREVDATGGATG